MTEAEKPAFHQRRYLVDFRFQLKYTLMVMVVSSAVFSVLGYELYRKTVSNTEILKIQYPDVQNLVQAADRQILFLLLAAFVLQVASLFILGILITHRIAGPVYRVKRYLEEVAETGDLKPLNSTRNRDEFKEFFDSLSAVVNLIRGRSDRQREKAAQLKAALDGADVVKARALAQELLALL